MTTEEWQEWVEIFYGKLYRVELDGQTTGFKEDIENEGRHEACLRFIVTEVQVLLKAEREASAKLIDDHRYQGVVDGLGDAIRFRDRPHEVNVHADALWEIAKGIAPDMRDVAGDLKETASHLHSIASQIRARMKKDEDLEN